MPFLKKEFSKIFEDLFKMALFKNLNQIYYSNDLFACEKRSRKLNQQKGSMNPFRQRVS